MSHIIGEDTLSVPHEMMGRIDMRVVLVQDDNGFVKAFRGCGSQEYVRRFGDELKLSGAIAHFPYLEQQLAAAGLQYTER